MPPSALKSRVKVTRAFLCADLYGPYTYKFCVGKLASKSSFAEGNYINVSANGIINSANDCEHKPA